MKKLLIIGTVWPEPASTAAGTRMLQLISFFQNLDYEICFSSTAALSEHSFDLDSIKVITKAILLNDPGFDDLLKNLNPDAVIFDRFMTEEQFGWRVSENCPNAVKILDTEDLHFLRKSRELDYKNTSDKSAEILLSDNFKREMASILRCDLSLIISEFEFELLINKYKIDAEILYYLPIYAEKFKGVMPEFIKRKNFMHIGNFLHEPNWQTVLKLKQIWKEIRQKLPGSELHIYGSYTTDKAKQLHNLKEGFLVKGRADSVEEVFLNYRVLLAPIPFGAGIKGKLLESMQYGLPNVTTEIGGEGMHDNNRWNGFITENDEDFVDRSVKLYSDEILWKTSQMSGFEILKNKFSKAMFAQDFSLKIRSISRNLPAHRNSNFLGQILQHHTLQSTKYMSKWIEEKNRKG